VVKACLCVYLPETRDLLGMHGPWSEEFEWQLRQGYWQPRSYTEPDELMHWVSEGVTLPGNVTQDFPTDGRLYAYSTLSPVSGSEGALQVVTISHHAFQGIVFAVTFLLGLLLLPARFSIRMVTLSVAVIALVLAGVFLPTFAMQTLNGAFFLAIFIVAVLWMMAWSVRRRSRRPVTPPQASTSSPPPELHGAVAPSGSTEAASTGSASPVAQEGETSHD
jgi:membrane protein implicated in regulation of membrane protease activity